MFIEQRALRFTFDPGRGHTSYQSIVFYKHANPPGFGDTSIVLHDHLPGTITINMLKAQHTLGNDEKQQPMATIWENKQNWGVRHKVLKVGEELFPVAFI